MGLYFQDPFDGGFGDVVFEIFELEFLKMCVWLKKTIYSKKL